MWVRIKSKVEPNTYLVVPEQAYLDVYSKKGFVLADEPKKETAKNEVVEPTETSQEISTKEKPAPQINDEEQKAIEEVRENNIAKQEELQKEQPKLTGNRGAKEGVPVRTPIKKPTVTKR